MSVELKFRLPRDAFLLDVDTSIPARGVTCVFGPSGSGKTTLLRCIAGLEKTADATPPERRNVGFVFQQPQLFEHLSVRGNIEYGAGRSKTQRVNIDEVVALLDLDKLLERRVQHLSGGEAQRVAIARALCRSPRIVLMDEPMSALDQRRKDRLLPYLDRIRAELDVPIVYVSHNIDEICRLCDHLLVIDNGRIVAEGALQDVLGRLDVPQLGGGNTGVMIETDVVGYDAEHELTSLAFPGGELLVPGRVSGSRCRVRVRASDVSLARQEPVATSILNVLPATVMEIAEEDASTRLVKLDLDNTKLIARVTTRSVQQLELQAGEKLFAQIKSVTVRC